MPSDQTTRDPSDPNTPRADEPRPVDGTAPAETHDGRDTADRELTRIKAERDHFEEQLKRALADAANMRRRQRQDMDDARHRILEGITQELLPVLDSFGTALQILDEPGATADPKALRDGVRMVRTLLSSALERHGLAEIRSEGRDFDPSRHEAVVVEPSSELPAGRVLRVLQTGYQLGDRVIRPAKVVVSGAPPATTGSEAAKPGS
jgi:molecular chaperone GrpE